MPEPIANSPEPTTPAPTQPKPQCRAIRTDGHRCRNTTRDGLHLCCRLPPNNQVPQERALNG